MEFNANDYQDKTKDELLTALSNVCRQNTLLEWQIHTLQYNVDFYKKMFEDYKEMLKNSHRYYDELYEVYLKLKENILN